MLLFLCILTGLAVQWVRLWGSALFAGLVIIIYVGLAFYLFSSYQVVIGVVPQVLTIVFAYTGVIVYRVLTAGRERRRVCSICDLDLAPGSQMGFFSGSQQVEFDWQAV